MVNSTLLSLGCGHQGRAGGTIEGVAQPEGALELRMPGEPFQQEADQAVVSDTDGTDDARDAAAAIGPGCFIPVLHMPVVPGGTTAPGGTPLKQVNSALAAHTRRQAWALRPGASHALRRHGCPSAHATELGALRPRSDS